MSKEAQKPKIAQRIHNQHFNKIPFAIRIASRKKIQKNTTFFLRKVWSFKIKLYFCIAFERKRNTNAEIAQLVEHNLAKVGVASSSLVFRSNF